MKRIISLVAVVAVAAAALFAVVAYGGRSTAAATTVKVTAKDTLRFTLSRKSAPHGKVIFKVTNKGRIKHDFKIAGKKTPLLSPGKSATLKVTLKKGKAGYLCAVSGHAAAGMKGTLTVK
jgi:nitrite reductase (NO-forming)